MSAKKFLCPRCFEEISENDIEYICSNQSARDNCQMAKNRTPQHPADPKHPVCSECGKPMIRRICPKCGGELPRNIGSSESYPIAIIGGKETGKSNYIGVLIDVLKNKVGRTYECALQACGDRTITRYREEFYNPIFNKKMCVMGTDSGEVDPLMYLLLFRKKGGFFHKEKTESVNLTFFDTAGENLDNLDSMQTYNRYLTHSSGIILLLDPLQLPYVRSELQGKIRLPEQNTDVNDILTRTIRIIRDGKNIPDNKKIDIPIAIVFTKIDAVESLLDPSSCLKNDSTHVQNGYFDKIDFNDENQEMQSLVSQWLGDGLNREVELAFNKYAFFGLSSLGSNPDMNNQIPKLRPFRVADPFLWLLAEKGIIAEK